MLVPRALRVELPLQLALTSGLFSQASRIYVNFGESALKGVKLRSHMRLRTGTLSNDAFFKALRTKLYSLNASQGLTVDLGTVIAGS